MFNIEKTPRWLPFAAVGLGAAGCLVRWGLYRLGMDEKGLMEPWHILKILLWLLTAAAAALCLMVGDKRKKTRACKQEALGEALAALGVAASLPGLGNAGGMLDWLQLVTGALGAAGLGYGAWCRYRDREGGIAAFGPVCVFLVFNLVARYQLWSSHPQVLDYLFQLLGAMSIMAFSYLRCVRKRHGLRRRIALFGIYCCLTALSAGELIPLYLGGGAWMALEWNAPGELL